MVARPRPPGMDRVTDSESDTVEAVAGAHLAQLAAGERISLQRFTIDPGAEVPEHDHRHEQAGYVVEGELTFLLDGGDERVVVGPGDSYVIPGGEPHAAVNEGETPVEGVDVFGPPRTDPDWADDPPAARD